MYGSSNIYAKGWAAGGGVLEAVAEPQQVSAARGWRISGWD